MQRGGLFPALPRAACVVYDVHRGAPIGVEKGRYQVTPLMSYELSVSVRFAMIFF